MPGFVEIAVVSSCRLRSGPASVEIQWDVRSAMVISKVSPCVTLVEIFLKNSASSRSAIYSKN